MSAIRAIVDFGQLILTRPDLGRESRASWRLNGTEVESAVPFGCVAGSGLPDTRTLSPRDPIFFYYTAMLWTGLHGVLAAVRPDG
jgi:hypothetical protein